MSQYQLGCENFWNEAVLYRDHTALHVLKRALPLGEIWILLHCTARGSDHSTENHRAVLRGYSYIQALPFSTAKQLSSARVQNTGVDFPSHKPLGNTALHSSSYKCRESVKTPVVPQLPHPIIQPKCQPHTTRHLPSPFAMFPNP